MRNTNGCWVFHKNIRFDSKTIKRSLLINDVCLSLYLYSWPTAQTAGSILIKLGIDIYTYHDMKFE